jgi:hypothetical protein
MTRNRSQLPTSTQQSSNAPDVEFDDTRTGEPLNYSATSLATSFIQWRRLAFTNRAGTGTRSRKVIHHLSDQPAENPSRSAKRQRTETSTSEATAARTDQALNFPFDSEPIAPSTLETNNAGHDDLQARAAARAAASTLYAKGAILLQAQTHARTEQARN